MSRAPRPLRYFPLYNYPIIPRHCTLSLSDDAGIHRRHPFPGQESYNATCRQCSLVFSSQRQLMSDGQIMYSMIPTPAKLHLHDIQTRQFISPSCNLEKHGEEMHAQSQAVSTNTQKVHIKEYIHCVTTNSMNMLKSDTVFTYLGIHLADTNVNNSSLNHVFWLSVFTGSSSETPINFNTVLETPLSLRGRGAFRLHQIDF